MRGFLSTEKKVLPQPLQSESEGNVDLADVITHEGRRIISRGNGPTVVEAANRLRANESTTSADEHFHEKIYL